MKNRNRKSNGIIKFIALSSFVFLNSVKVAFAGSDKASSDIFKGATDYSLLSVYWNYLFAIALVVAALSALYGGYLIMTSNGDSKRIDAGKSRIIIVTLSTIVLFSLGKMYGDPNFISNSNDPNPIFKMEVDPGATATANSNVPSTRTEIIGGEAVAVNNANGQPLTADEISEYNQNQKNAPVTVESWQPGMAAPPGYHVAKLPGHTTYSLYEDGTNRFIK